MNLDVKSSFVEEYYNISTHTKYSVRIYICSGLIKKISGRLEVSLDPKGTGSRRNLQTTLVFFNYAPLLYKSYLIYSCCNDNIYSMAVLSS